MLQWNDERARSQLCSNVHTAIIMINYDGHDVWHLFQAWNDFLCYVRARGKGGREFVTSIKVVFDLKLYCVAGVDAMGDGIAVIRRKEKWKRGGTERKRMHGCQRRGCGRRC